MNKAAVIGDPIAHSLSPELHGYWLKKYKIEGEYTRIQVKADDLERFILDLPKSGLSGINITLPHKEAVCSILKKYQMPLSKAAEAAGAVNTILIKDGTLQGENTDWIGFGENIKSELGGKKVKKSVVLGAGGASRAVLLYLILSLKCPDIILINRSKGKAQKLKDEMDEFIAQVDSNSVITIADWGVHAEAMEKADLLINTTSLGMTGQPPLEVDLSKLPEDALVTDIVYKPLETDLLRRAKENGNPTVDGIGMLLYQAQPIFQHVFGVMPEVDEGLRNHMLDYLGIKR